MAQNYFEGAKYSNPQTSDGNPNNGGVTASSVSSQLAAANPSRRAIIITNSGSVDVFLSLGDNAAVAGKGIYSIGPGGAIDSPTLNKWGGAIQVITSSGSAVVTFVEL